MAFSKRSTEFRRFQGLLARKRLKPSTFRQGVKGTAQEWAEAAAQEGPLSSPVDGPGGHELKLWPHFSIRLIPNGSCRPLLPFCNLILEEHSRQGPRHGGQAPLSSELVHGSVAAQQRPWDRNIPSSPSCPKADLTPQKGAKATPSPGFQWASNETPVRFWGMETESMSIKHTK